MKTLYINTAWRKRDWLTTEGLYLLRKGTLIHANLKITQYILVYQDFEITLWQMNPAVLQIYGTI